MAFKKKIIRITITLQGTSDVFIAKTDYNQLQTDGFRVSCAIQYGNGALSPTANIRIYGMSFEKMNNLVRVHWNTLGAVQNRIRVEVGEQGDDALINAYEGNITFARIDMSNLPNQALVIDSQCAVVEQLKPASPSSPYSAGIDASDIIKDIAVNRMGYTFTNSGATHIMSDATTLEGSDLGKIQALCAQVGFDVYIDQGSIEICPKGGARTLKIPIISMKSGQIGYPTQDTRGISFKAFYDPSIRFGGICTIKDSDIFSANGDWRIYGVNTMLEANMPNGRWEMDINATWRGNTDVVTAN
jgi:hypothetical protein